MPTLELTSVIYPAEDAVIDEVRRLRGVLPASGVPVMEAHVTLYGTIYDLEPDEALARLQHICRLHPPVQLRAVGVQVWLGRGGPPSTVNENRQALYLDPLPDGDEPSASLAMPVFGQGQEGDRALRELNIAAWSALADEGRTKGTFGSSANFVPHLTLVQSMPRRLVLEALDVLGDMPEYEFEGREVALMQREPDGFTLVGTAPLLG